MTRGGFRNRRRYAIVVEKAPTGYSAYAPDLPGCAAAGATREEAVDEMRRAIRFHLESLREHGEPAPKPGCTAAVVDADAVG